VINFLSIAVPHHASAQTLSAEISKELAAFHWNAFAALTGEAAAFRILHALSSLKTEGGFQSSIRFAVTRKPGRPGSAP
jgi:hypothetical protein